MPYAVKADLEARFGALELVQLTDETNIPPTTADDAEISAAIDEASSLVDGFLRARYTLPLSPVPDVVKKWTCDIARFFLHGDRAPKGSAVREAYDDAVERLQECAAGKFRLVSDTGDQAAQSAGGIAVSASTRVFSDELLGLMP